MKMSIGLLLVVSISFLGASAFAVEYDADGNVITGFDKTFQSEVSIRTPPAPTPPAMTQSSLVEGQPTSGIILDQNGGMKDPIGRSNNELLHAVKTQNFELVKKAIAEGASANVKDVEGIPALTVAVSIENTDPRIVNCFLKIMPKSIQRVGMEQQHYMRRLTQGKALKL